MVVFDIVLGVKSSHPYIDIVVPPSRDPLEAVRWKEQVRKSIVRQVVRNERSSDKNAEGIRRIKWFSVERYRVKLPLG